MSRFFIDRPIFAWVIAIILMLAAGLISLVIFMVKKPASKGGAGE